MKKTTKKVVEGKRKKKVTAKQIDKLKKYPASTLKNAISIVLRQKDKKITNMGRVKISRIESLMNEGILNTYKNEILKKAEELTEKEKSDRPIRRAQKDYYRKEKMISHILNEAVEKTKIITREKAVQIFKFRDRLIKDDARNISSIIKLYEKYTHK